jgi:hypothetical protein
MKKYLYVSNTVGGYIIGKCNSTARQDRLKQATCNFSSFWIMINRAIKAIIMGVWNYKIIFYAKTNWIFEYFFSYRWRSQWYISG